MSRLPRPVIPPPLPPPLPADLYEPRPPPIVVVTGPQPQPEMPWHSQSLLAYVKSAVLVFLLSVMLFSAWSVWRFAASVRGSWAEVESKRSAAETTARKFAIDRLRPHGITRIAKDSSFLFLPPIAGLSGLSEDNAGKLQEYSIRWRVAEFEGATRWEMRYITIGGKVVEGDIIGN